MLVKIQITWDINAKVSCFVNFVQGLIVHGVLAVYWTSCPSDMHNNALFVHYLD